MHVDASDYPGLFGTLAGKPELDDRTRATAARIANWFTAYGTSSELRDRSRLWATKPFVGDPFRDTSAKLASDGIRFLLEWDDDKVDVDIR